MRAKFQAAVEGVVERVFLVISLKLLNFGLGVSVVGGSQPGGDALLNFGGERHEKKGNKEG
jgi:hypothetical protein